MNGFTYTSVIDERDISAEVMAELLMDDKVSTYKMFEELEDLRGSEKYDNKTIDMVLMTITGYSFDEIKEMVDERVSASEF